MTKKRCMRAIQYFGGGTCLLKRLNNIHPSYSDRLHGKPTTKSILQQFLMSVIPSLSLLWRPKALFFVFVWFTQFTPRANTISERASALKLEGLARTHYKLTSGRLLGAKKLMPVSVRKSALRRSGACILPTVFGLRRVHVSLMQAGPLLKS